MRRGVDPRKFALLSFGGAAGLHAAEVARELEIKRIIVPTVASVLSAWGMLTSDLRYEVSRTHYGAGARISADEVRELFAELEQQAAGRLRSWFNGPDRHRALRRDALRRADFRDRRARSTVSTGTPPISSTRSRTAFIAGTRSSTPTPRAARKWCSSTRASPRSAKSRSADRGHSAGIVVGACAPRGKRQAFFGGWREVPVYALDDLRPGHTLTGPAIIEAETTTVLVDTGDRVTVNALGWLDIALR